MFVETSAYSKADIMIMTVLVEYELPSLQATLGFNPYPSPKPDEVHDGVNIWYTVVKGENERQWIVALSYIPQKGQMGSLIATQKALEQIKPRYAFLVGSAGGFEDKVKACDVVVSTKGILYYEQDSSVQELPPSVLDVARSLHKATLQALNWQKTCDEILKKLDPSSSDPLPKPESPPSVHFQQIATGEKMIDMNTIKQLQTGQEKQFEHVYAFDQESYGFVMACKDRFPWLVIRGISDFGPRGSRKHWQRTATLMASTWLKLFIENYLEPHGDSLDRLTSDSPYMTKSISAIFREEMRRNGIDVGARKFTIDWNITKLFEFCTRRYPDKDPSDLKRLISDARAEAFTQKYGRRTEDQDERFILLGRKKWLNEIWEILRHLNIQKSQFGNLDVINVGIGTGVETKGFLDKHPRLTGVDISQSALQQATLACPQMHAMKVDAEDLKIGDATQDLYISLRTYSSRLFDYELALAEADRVTRRNGKILVSIPYVFLGENQKIVKGLLIPETDKVDPDLPYDHYVSEIRRDLQKRSFSNIEIHTGGVEIYISGVK